MCGRFTREYTWRQLHELLSLTFEFPEQWQGSAAFAPSYNVAPTQDSPVCRAARSGGDGAVPPGREVVPMQWGLRPAWVDKPGLAPINARSETVATSPMFRQAFKKRRCLVPVSGFYEWKKDGDRKRPHYIRLRDQPVMCFAGLWEFRGEGSSGNAKGARDAERGKGGGGEGAPLLTFTILTTRPNALMKDIHDRMPVIVDPPRFEEWLGEDVPDPSMFEPFAAGRMEAFEVSTRVNSPKNNNAALVEPVARDGLFG
ncbi:MAG: SOS response-associated peptidase [Phycisphaerales bacterium]|nr:SOS response-associated peptidase [Phycisphaerales bacterium]